jgi:Protein of unknown function (DUF2934)
MADIDVVLPEDAIKLRSYFIWRREGCPAGKELSHWLQAKAELDAELRAADYPPPPGPAAFVMPRIKISAAPNKRISAKINCEAA